MGQGSGGRTGGGSEGVGQADLGALLEGTLRALCRFRADPVQGYDGVPESVPGTRRVLLHRRGPCSGQRACKDSNRATHNSLFFCKGCEVFD